MSEANRRQIRLTYVATGASVVAEMLDDEAGKAPLRRRNSSQVLFGIEG